MAERVLAETKAQEISEKMADNRHLGVLSPGEQQPSEDLESALTKLESKSAGIRSRMLSTDTMPAVTLADVDELRREGQEILGQFAAEHTNSDARIFAARIEPTLIESASVTKARNDALRACESVFNREHLTEELKTPIRARKLRRQLKEAQKAAEDSANFSAELPAKLARNLGGASFSTPEAPKYLLEQFLAGANPSTDMLRSQKIAALLSRMGGVVERAIEHPNKVEELISFEWPSIQEGMTEMVQMEESLLRKPQAR